MDQKKNMKRLSPAWPLVLLLCAAGANAQLYKWTGPDGSINYSNVPPPASARVETKPLPGGQPGNASLPFELSEASKNHPVTLYTTQSCAACDEGRKLLAGRGIPFNEKTVNTNDDVARFRTVSSDGQLPLVFIGRSKQQGFDPSQWNSALTAAGYPQTSKLPKNYRQPPTEPMAPMAKSSPTPAEARPPVNEAAAGKPNAGVLPPAAGNAPPGFRF